VILPALATEVVARFPKLRLRMTIEQRRNLLPSLLAGELDLIIVATEEDLEAANLHQIDLMTDEVIAVTSPTHPLAGRRGIAPGLFAQHAGATSATSAAFTPKAILGLTEDQADRAGYYASNDFGTIRALARAGVATAMGPSHLFKDDFDSGALIRLDLDTRFSVKIVAAMTRAAAYSSILMEVAAIAKRVASRLSTAADPGLRSIRGR
jgi:DNA-binding transcriptional LysR family regulator